MVGQAGPRPDTVRRPVDQGEGGLRPLRCDRGRGRGGDGRRVLDHRQRPDARRCVASRGLSPARPRSPCWARSPTAIRSSASCGTYDAVLVPSVPDEQPRIAYDALSQAVPVLGSATGGISQVVESGVSGRLSPPNDVAALVESILWAGRHREELREMGLRGLASVRKATHQEMHRTRHKLLVQALGSRPDEPKTRN